MSKVNILHLSDLHFGRNPSKKAKGEEEKARSEVLDKLLEKLKSLNNIWKPDIIVISGDVGASGNVEDYKKAWVWIKRLLDILNLKSTRLVISPGNHDKNIQDKDSIFVPKSCEEADEIIKTERLKIYFSAFESFKENNGILPLRFKGNSNYLFGHKQVLGLQFIILNSAWFATGRLEDEKRMVIGIPHIKSLIEEGILKRPNMNNKIIISVVHHPPEWLHQGEQDKFGGRSPPYVKLAKNCDIIFSGHTHGEEFFDADKKYGGAFLFKTGAVYDSETRIFTCEILRIDTEDRIASRLILDFNKENEHWVDQIEEYKYIFSNDISRLKQHSRNIQNQIIDTIGKNCKVHRNNVLTEMNEKILNHDIIFITGEAMVGKSVVLKDIASNLNQNNYLFFNVSRFKFSNLNHYLKSLNIINEFKSILASYNTEESKYILIDDVERIRESENKLTVFKDILTAVFSLNLESEINHWKLILSCRSEYFLNVSNIIEKFSKDLNLKKTNNTIQPFNNEELEQVINSFPKLKSLIQNPHLEKIIEIPKLLDVLTFENFILKEGEISQDFNYSYYTETYLLKQFWAQIVRNNEQILPSNLNPEERERFLQKIASHMLSNSTPYLIAEEDNVELYQSLISERILKRDGDQLSFTHDLFEEWVLVRSMLGKPDIVSDFIIIFNDSKRINRSFRLYSRYLIEISEDLRLWKSIFDSIRAKIEINPIWKQDFIYGILKSEILIEILPILKDSLLMDDNKVLKEFFKLLQIKCVIFEEDSKPDIHIWFPIILYVIDNLFSELSGKSLLSFTEIVEKWLFKFNIPIQEFFNKILNRYIEFAESKIIIKAKFDDLSYQKGLNLKKNILFTILWGLSYNSEEITLFLDKVIESTESKHIFEDVLFDKYGYILLCRHVPEYALKVLKLYIIKKKEEIPERIDRYEDPLSSHAFFKDIYYEIKAPFYNFLNHNEDYGLNLIHDVINHATKIWIHTDEPAFYGPVFNRISEHRTPLAQKIQFSDKVVEVWGDEVVYSWYMPLGMGPRVVMFALTALEHWIFEQILEKNRDPSEIITKVLKNTISFSVVAVSIISILHLFSEYMEKKLDVNYDDLIKAIQPVIEKSAFWSLDLTRSINYGILLKDYRSLNLEYLFSFIKFNLRDNGLKNDLLSKISKFSEDIFIFFEEEKSCKPLLTDRFAHMRRLEEATKDENWHPLEINGQSILKFILPKELQNDAEKDFYEEKFTLASIQNGIYFSFEAGEIKPQINPENLLKYIEKLIEKDENVQIPIAFTELSAERAEVITGFFALLILYDWEFIKNNKLEKKAKDIILRAVRRPQALNYIKSSVSLYSMGYKRSAARAIPILYQRYPKNRKIKNAIIQLIKYNNNEVRNFLFTHLALIWKKNYRMNWKWIKILFKESLKRGIKKKDRYYIINKSIQIEQGFSPRIQFENVKKIDLLKLHFKKSLEISLITIKNKNLKDLNPEEIDLTFFSSVLHIIPQGPKIVEIFPKEKLFSFLENILLFTIKADIFNKTSYEENKIKYHNQNLNFHFYDKWGNKALNVIGNAVLFLELDKVRNYFIKPILSLWKNSENILKVFLREFIIISNQPHIEERFIEIWDIADHIFKLLLDKEQISYEVVYYIFLQDNYGHIFKKNFELETSIKRLNFVINKFLNTTTYYYPILRLVNEVKNPLLYTTVISLLYERLKSFSFNGEKHTRLRRELYILIERFWTAFQEKIETDENLIRKIEFLCEILIDWGEIHAGKLYDIIKNQ